MSLTKIYCQLCAELKPRDKLVDLLEDKGQLEETVSKLTRVNAVSDFTENQMPKTVCFVCLETLDNAYNFVTSVERAQLTINEILFLQSEVLEDSTDDEIDMKPCEIECSDSSVEQEVPSPEQVHPLLEQEEPLPEQKFHALPEQSDLNSSFDTLPSTTEGNDVEINLYSNGDIEEGAWASYRWFCKYCEVLFPNIKELRIHSMKFHNSCIPYRCQHCISETDSLKRFLKHAKKHDEHLKYSCYICYKKYTVVADVRDHYRYEHEETDHMCPGCNLYFDTEEELNQHIKEYYKKRYTYHRHNPPPKDLACPICNKVLKSRRGFIYHERTAHTGRNKIATCDQCGKSYASKNSLKIHMLNHNEENPFKCEICKKSFKTSIRLRNHFTIHSTDKPYKCDECGRGFRVKSQLKTHQIIHTNSLPFKCGHCSKHFRFKSTLVIHERVHSGVKPYSCDICQKDFTNWSNYNKHMKRKHNKNMAKEKNKLTGLEVDPKTGELSMKPEATEWLNKMKQQKPGRPKKVHKNNSS